jgi:hypothetical protein
MHVFKIRTFYLKKNTVKKIFTYMYLVVIMEIQYLKKIIEKKIY